MIETRKTSVAITVEYFAMFRDCARKNSEILDIETACASEVYDQLRIRYAFPLEKNNILLAVNDEFASWDKPLQSGDRVIFLPPVCGG